VRLLLCVSLGLPLISVLIVEALQHNTSEKGCIPFPGNNFKPCMHRVLRVMLDFLIGFFFTLFLAEMLKTSVGELRPHFLDTCKPDGYPDRCKEEDYITNYTCTSTYPPALVKDSFKSFPSSHSVTAFYSSVFLMLYFQVRRCWNATLLCPWLQLMCLSWASFCGVSRITDHRHHWWDVLFGAILGSVFAVATVSILCQWFHAKCDVRISLNEGIPPEKRISTRRLISPSSSTLEPKDVENVPVKNLDSNHV